MVKKEKKVCENGRALPPAFFEVGFFHWAAVTLEAHWPASFANSGVVRADVSECGEEPGKKREGT